MKTRTITYRAAILFLLVALGQKAGAQSWKPFSNTYYGFSTGVIATDRFPQAAFAADLDGDGDQDVVVAQGNQSSGFAVMLNNGSGFYTLANHYYTGQASMDVCVADFTGDGKPDVAVSNPGTYGTNNTISLFPGNGNGTFGTPSSFTVGTAPIGLATADFNGDGKPDLAVANEGTGSGNTITILLNNGTGSFTSQWTATTPSAPFKLQAAQMNTDALPDLVVADEQQKLTVLINTGSGFTATNYTQQSVVWAGDGAPNVQVADVDNDGDRDVLYSSGQTWDGTSGNILLRRNTGNGTLGPIETIVLPYFTTGAQSMAVADLNNDGYVDIIASSSEGRTTDGYSVLLNQGNGTFGTPTLRPGGEWTLVVLAADVDGDGDKDVLTVDNYTMELTVHTNKGSGQFPTPNFIAAGLASATTKLDVADMDNDGDLDILISADSRTAVNAPVIVVRNNGNGTYASPVTITPMYMGGTGAKFRDLNGDGLKDIVFASGIQNSAYHFHTALNTGNGTFGAVQTWNMNACGWNDIDAADIDGDGDLDVIATEWLGCQNVALSARRIFISKNNGNGTFTAPTINVVNPFPGPIALCDFNEDGKIDLATGQSTSVDISLGDGTGNFLAPVSYTMAQSPFDILATDLNGDGHIDIVSCNYGSGPGDYNITIRMGIGNGTFSAVQQLPTAYSPDLANVSGLAAGDVDGDGDLDIIVGQGASNDMAVYYNQNGVFSQYVRVGTYYGASSPWFADFDGDGHGDVAVLVNMPPSGYQNALMLLKGTTTGLTTGGSGLSACSPTATTPTGVAYTGTIPPAIAIYPNPTTDAATLSLTLPQAGYYTVQLYNSIGQPVQNIVAQQLHSGTHIFSIQRGTLPTGVYMLQVAGNGTKQTRKIVFEY